MSLVSAAVVCTRRGSLARRDVSKTYQELYAEQLIRRMRELVDRKAPATDWLIAVIEDTHANGYGHFNPWQECDHPLCERARREVAHE